jgi:catechol 2,3-dioxygenase-like lactoylglutathione lyase family enzyme
MGFRQVSRRYLEPGSGTGVGPLRTGQDPHNRVTLDFSDSTDFNQRHFAFLVSEEEFDAALARIRAAGVKHYANFRREQPGEINHFYGGRGVYFDDPKGI